MALQIPNFGQLSPAPPANPVDRFGKIAAIQDMIQGNQIKQQQLQINQQEQARLQAKAAREDTEYKDVAAIFADPANQGDIEKSMKAVLASPKVGAATKKTFQDMLEGQTGAVMDKKKFEETSRHNLAEEANQRLTLQANEAKANLVEVSPGATLFDRTQNKDVYTAPSRPLATGDPYQTREQERGGKVYIQTYAKDDPQAKTISEIEKGPVHSTAQTFNLNNPTEGQDTVKFIADQVRDNPLNWNLTGGNKTLQNQVRRELAGGGGDVLRLTAATRQLGETADAIVPKIDATIKKLDNPKFVAALGPVMGRWNEFRTGKVGSNDPELAQLRATLALIQTGTMRAHVGARGSEGLLEKFQSLVDGSKMDATTLKGSLTGIRDFLQGYRDAIHKEGGSATGGAQRGTYNPATGKVEYK